MPRRIPYFLTGQFTVLPRFAPFAVLHRNRNYTLHSSPPLATKYPFSTSEAAALATSLRASWGFLPTIFQAANSVKAAASTTRTLPTSGMPTPGGLGRP